MAAGDKRTGDGAQDSAAAAIHPEHKRDSGAVVRESAEIKRGTFASSACFAAGTAATYRASGHWYPSPAGFCLRRSCQAV